MRATAAVAIDGTRRRSFGRACHLGPPISRAQRVPERKSVVSPLLVKRDYTLGHRSLVPISRARRVSFPVKTSRWIFLRADRLSSSTISSRVFLLGIIMVDTKLFVDLSHDGIFK